MYVNSKTPDIQERTFEYCDNQLIGVSPGGDHRYANRHGDCGWITKPPFHHSTEVFWY